MTRVQLHALPIRAWHWVNAFLIVLLILTGVQLRAPDLSLFGRYANAVWLHKYAGFAASGSFIFWFIYVLFSKAFWRHYVLKPSDVKRMPRQAFFYGFDLFRGAENPFKPTPASKFNPMQKVAYFSIMAIITPVIVITGLLFSDIMYFHAHVEAMGGLRVLDAIHVVAAYVFLLYLLVHLYMATMGHTVLSHFKAMIVGYEEEPHTEADSDPH
jgi:thiosulfate reductase cytochrome b subunit